MAGRSRGQEAAEALRHRLGLGTAPVDPFDVLHRLGVEVYLRPFDDDSLEGAFAVRNGHKFVFVNSSRAITRQRLTAAHELGHLELDAREGDQAFEENISLVNGDADEQEAFRFARYFLMDERGVRELVASLKDGHQRVAAVASTYIVSPEVAAIFLADLRLITATAKRELQSALREQRITPNGLLRRYGYRMAWTPEPEHEGELDAAHLQRSITAYESGWLTLAGFADALMKTPAEARQVLEEAGVAVRDEAADGQDS